MGRRIESNDRIRNMLIHKLTLQSHSQVELSDVTWGKILKTLLIGIQYQSALPQCTGIGYFILVLIDF